MEFRLLGPLEVEHDGVLVSLPAGKPRALLVLLALNANEPQATDLIVDALWGDGPPASAAGVVQTYVSRLRKLLGENRIETVGNGYALHLSSTERDIDQVDALYARSRSETPARAGQSLREAISLFRGQPLADVVHEEFAQRDIRRLEELRATLVAARVEADLGDDRSAAVLVPELEALVAQRPLDERLRRLLMIALYRSGRQADALAVYKDVRRTLMDELGIEPSKELRDVERDILRQEPLLDAPVGGVPDSVGSPAAPARRRRHMLIAGAGLLVVGVGALALALVTGGEADRLKRVPSGSVGLIDPRDNNLIAALEVGDAPTSVVAGAGAVWALIVGEGTVVKIDPRRIAVERKFSVPGKPTALATGEGALWVLDGFEPQLFRIEPRTGHVERRILLPGARPVEATVASAIVVDGQRVIVSINVQVPRGGKDFSTERDYGRTVWRVDSRSGDVKWRLGNVKPAGGGDSLMFASGRLWLGVFDELVELDPKTGEALGSVDLIHRHGGMASNGRYIWLSSDDAVAHETDEITRVDTLGLNVEQHAPVGREPLGIAIDDGSVWVANSLDGTVSRIDATSGHTVATIEIGGRPQGVVVADGLVWVTVA